MNPKPFIVGLGGSLREQSYSRAALQTALDQVKSKGADTELLDLRALNLPMYVPDQSIENYPDAHQPAIRHFIDTCHRADAMIWSSPTYHGTVSGVFKNAIDFLEFIRNHQPAYLTGKAIGLIAISDSMPFNAMADIVYELRAWLAPTRIDLKRADFTAELVVHEARVLRRMERLATDLLSFTSKGG